MHVVRPNLLSGRREMALKAQVAAGCLRLWRARVRPIEKERSAPQLGSAFLCAFKAMRIAFQVANLFGFAGFFPAAAASATRSFKFFTSVTQFQPSHSRPLEIRRTLAP